ncbi:synaptonemal complex central element protein 2 [Astyanax mexicanus]|uniref:Synaptonemal complex central element protein 2 n=2 Tax=Astyanax mexicanus TaxID=7994 RepID=A0A3B1JB43_ASTMX|nr:synaptonemal complex central element protein 2 [Astyanax mexicanus]KAG9264509.1 synaptonemal complex central element protein 2-like [Astyanax mexicanus]
MAQHFFGHPGSATFQSTPKAGPQRVPVKAAEEGQNIDYDSTGETLSFVTLDDSHEQQSEDSGINISSRSSPVTVPVDDSIVSSPVASRIDEIGKKAQDLIERINQSRAMDQKILNSFEEKLMQKVGEMCQQVKEQMFEYYDKHSQGMEVRLTELSEVLERSSQLSMELQGASQTLAAINKGLQQTGQ